MENICYEAARKQLEEIVGKMESGELDIDSLCKELKVAQGLLKACKERLMKTEEEVEEILKA